MLAWSPSSRGRGLKCISSSGVTPDQSSPSSRGRGLKYSCRHSVRVYAQVALFTRAWIEITHQLIPRLLTVSPSSRGRGLKYRVIIVNTIVAWSPSSRGRGLKSIFEEAHREILWSPSSRGRGLKYLQWQSQKCLRGRPLHEGVD